MKNFSHFIAIMNHLIITPRLMIKTVLLTLALAFPVALHAVPSCCSTNTPAAGPFTDASLYQVESTWTSDYGKSIALSTLRGRPQIITMFFASCHLACPILVHDMKKLESALTEAGITNVGFTLITMDTERDTVEALHDFRLRQQLGDNWLLLRSDAQDTLEIAALLGVKYKKEPSGQFAHSNIITLLNSEGEIIHQQVGLNTDPAPTVAALQKLLHH